MLGLNPMIFLREKDLWVRSLYQAVAQAAREIQRKHDRERANQIAYEVMSMASGKRT